MLTTRLILPLVLLAAGLAVPVASPAGAATIAYEVAHVSTVDGAKIRVEIQRDTRFDRAKQPVILEYSPYNSGGEPRPAEGSRITRLVEKGYAYAVADVLGTRGSTGCWDYGGRKEQLSGADVVRYLSRLPWSNGRVGMTGVSYVGTTANMVAALGDEISADANGGRGLAGIIPVAAISRWYGYAYGDGVRFLGNSRVPTDEGFDTPLAFDFGFGRTVSADPSDPERVGTAQARTGECGALEHTRQAYSRSPDYGPFWLERDYRKDAAKFRVPVLVVHGWQDYNVKQEEGTALFEALPVDNPRTRKVEGVPFKKLWMTQGAHTNGSGPGYQELVDLFWERTLKGVRNGVEKLPVATSLGRTAAGAAKEFGTSGSWPPAGTAPLSLHLGRSFDTVPGAPPGLIGSTGENGVLRLAPQRSGAGWTHLDTGAATEEVTARDPSNRGAAAGPQPVRGHGYGWLYHESDVLKSDVRLAGSAVLDTVVDATSTGQHLTPVLVEVLPSGLLTVVARGFLNLDYRNGLAKAEPRTAAMAARVRFLPQDYTFTKGSRVGLILQGSNTVWAVPGAPGLLSYTMGAEREGRLVGSRLILPLVGAKAARVLAQ